jgi:hypothetical protein
MLKNISLALIAFLAFAGLAVGCVFALAQTGFLAAITGTTPVVNRGAVILERVQALSLLTTTRYNYSLTITSQRDMPGILAALYGESLLFVAVGHVVAGVDLSQLTVRDVVEGDGVITIMLPPAALQDCFLNDQESYVVRRDTGIFANPSPDLDNSARRYAVEQLRTAALENGIIANAEAQARLVVTELVETLAESQAQIISTPPDPASPLPSTCGG